MNFRNLANFSTIVALSFMLLAHTAFAAESEFSASGFAQFCAKNPSICKKVDVSGRKAGLKCPDFNNQIATKVYVHAGDGQVIYEMPHVGFNYAINLYGVGGAEVEVTTHKHDLSWVAVECSSKSTPSQSPTVTPANTLTPTQTPTSTDTPGVTETPTQSPTPMPSESQSSNNSNSGSTSNDSGRGGAEILGATTLAFTGGFETGITTVIFLGGLSAILQGIRFALKK